VRCATRSTGRQARVQFQPVIAFPPYVPTAQTEIPVLVGHDSQEADPDLAEADHPHWVCARYE
jgi:hypothetical protein